MRLPENGLILLSGPIDRWQAKTGARWREHVGGEAMGGAGSCPDARARVRAYCPGSRRPKGCPRLVSEAMTHRLPSTLQTSA